MDISRFRHVFFLIKKNIAPPALSKPFWGIFRICAPYGQGGLQVFCWRLWRSFAVFVAIVFSFQPLTILTWVVACFLRILVIFLRFVFEITVDNFLLNNFLQKLLVLFVFVQTYFAMVLARACICLGCVGIMVCTALICCVIDC